MTYNVERKALLNQSINQSLSQKFSHYFDVDTTLLYFHRTQLVKTEESWDISAAIPKCPNTSAALPMCLGHFGNAAEMSCC